MSARTELARLVLQVLSSGDPVSTQDALQLRSWALTPDDAILSLKAIALLILNQEENTRPDQLKLQGWAYTQGPVPCEEWDRLNSVYLAATGSVFSAGKTAPNMTSAKWREATQKARAICKAALADLKRHRKEHGC